MRTSKGTRWSLWLLVLLGVVPGVFLLGLLFGDADPPADAEEPVASAPTGELAEAREPPVVEAAPDQRVPAALEPPLEEVALPGLRGVVLDVRDGEESPAHGILVTLEAPHDDYETTTTTNEAGRFEFSLGNGELV